MSTIKEMLDALSKEVEALNEAIKDHDKDVKEYMEEMSEERKALSQKKSVVEEKVKVIQGILSAIQEPFDTLLALSVAGNITTSDIKTFADEIGIEVDEKFLVEQESRGPDQALTG